MDDSMSDNIPQPETSSVLVDKPIPYTYDLGHLLLNDANPIVGNLSGDAIVATSRDCAQALVNQLLSTCEIQSLPIGLHLSLPAPLLLLPREKIIPKDKEPTKWERFAAKRGIKPTKREGKLVYDDATGEWVPKYGYKGNNKAAEFQWLMEVDTKKESRTGEASNPRSEKRAERMEKIKRQQRRERANQRTSTTKSSRGS